MIAYILFALAVAWLLALEIRHHSLKADNAALVAWIEKQLGVRVKP